MTRTGKLSSIAVLVGSLIAVVAQAWGDIPPAPANAPNPMQTPASHPASEGAAPPESTVPSQDFSSSLTGGWFGLRQKLADKGMTIDVELTEDGTKNFRGGLDTAGRTWRRLLEPTLTFDTKPLLGIEGGTIYVDFQNADGPNASDKLIGDIQGVDGLDGVPGTPHQNRTQLAQLWYQQTAFNGVLRLKLGKVDSNSEFDRSAVAIEFLNQSTGSSATLFTMPTYPDPATSINVFVKPNADLQIGFGMYDGSLASGVRTGDRGPKTFFHNPDDLFFIGEIDQSWKLTSRQLTGRLGIGGWYSTNTFTRLDGAHVTGTGGPYAARSMSCGPNPANDADTRGVSAFLMYGYADPTLIPYGHNLGAGLTWTGPIPKRPSDVVGIGIQAIRFSDAYHARKSVEASYETFYRFQVTPWFFIKPDLQYIANPGGKDLADALALTVRFDVHF